MSLLFAMYRDGDPPSGGDSRASASLLAYRSPAAIAGSGSRGPVSHRAAAAVAVTPADDDDNNDYVIYRKDND